MISLEQKQKLDKIVYYSKIIVSIPVAIYVSLMLSISFDVFFESYSLVYSILYSVVSGIVLAYAFYHTALYISPNKNLFFLRTLLTMIIIYSVAIFSLGFLYAGDIDLVFIIEMFAYIIPLIATAVYLHKKPPFV